MQFINFYLFFLLLLTRNL